MNDLPKKRDPRALNAYRHGLTGQVYFFTPEDEAAYNTHCERIRASLAPVGGMEEDLVQAICDDRWRLKRAAGWESAIIAAGISQPDTLHGGNQQVDAALAHGRVWGENAKDLNLLTIYEGRFQRRVEKNVKMLKELQAERRAACQKAAEEIVRLTQIAGFKGETYDAREQYPFELVAPQFCFSTTEIIHQAAHLARLDRAKHPVLEPQRLLKSA